MKFHRIEFRPPRLCATPEITYVQTLDGLKEFVKNLPRDLQKHVLEHEFYDFVEVEIPTDKEAITLLLNGGMPTVTEGQAYWITNRGGLKKDEVPK